MPCEIQLAIAKLQFLLTVEKYNITDDVTTQYSHTWALRFTIYLLLLLLLPHHTAQFSQTTSSAAS